MDSHVHEDIGARHGYRSFQKRPRTSIYRRPKTVIRLCHSSVAGSLSSQGRSIKPCLVHGDLWDENCATDMASGEPFAFDAGSLFAHNEYEIGYWRPPRHRLSNKASARSYKRFFPVSEPGMCNTFLEISKIYLTTLQRMNVTIAICFTLRGTMLDLTS